MTWYLNGAGKSTLLRIAAESSNRLVAPLRTPGRHAAVSVVCARPRSRSVLSQHVTLPFAFAESIDVGDDRTLPTLQTGAHSKRSGDRRGSTGRSSAWRTAAPSPPDTLWAPSNRRSTSHACWHRSGPTTRPTGPRTYSWTSQRPLSGRSLSASHPRMSARQLLRKRCTVVAISACKLNTRDGLRRSLRRRGPRALNCRRYRYPRRPLGQISSSASLALRCGASGRHDVEIPLDLVMNRC